MLTVTMVKCVYFLSYFCEFFYNKQVLFYSQIKRIMLFYNKYVEVCLDKTNTIRNQNLLNRIMLHSWQGLVSF